MTERGHAGSEEERVPEPGPGPGPGPGPESRPGGSGDRPERRPGRLLAAVPIYAGFAASGVGVALPGAVLPALAARWHWNDAQSGQLFLMAFIGSSIGALVVRGSLRRTLLLASLAIALGAAGLGAASLGAASPGTASLGAASLGTASLGPASPGMAAPAGLTPEIDSRLLILALMAVYGCGLGAAMTAISLIRQQQADHVGREFVRLNLLWAVGALLAPSLALPALAGGSARPVFWWLGAGFLLLAAWTVSLPDLQLERTGPAESRPWEVFRAVPWGLILMVGLATGIEAAAGAWLATFARRGDHRLAETIAAPTCLWAGLLLSRLFWSVFARWLPPAAVVRGSVALMAASMLLLVGAGDGAPVLLAAFGLGFGLGPTYPLLLAWSLGFHRGGAIFFLAGVGSSTLPWLTGMVSNARGSLRLGLGVPVAGTLLMLALALLLPLTRWRVAPGSAALPDPGSG